MSAGIFLLPAFFACLILTGIHTYLGLHVLARGVVFIDIALAQLAALGLTVAFLVGHPPESRTAYFIALAFAVVGAAFLAWARDRRVSQEAVIGVVYALATALAVVIADRLPHGAEHLKFLLNGNILWVSPWMLLKTAALYAALGILHYLFRRPLWLVSSQPEKAAQQGLAVGWWDFIFYVSFALVITSSVAIAGILLVFSLLIAPAAMASLFCRHVRTQLALGWAIGVAASFLGIVFSYVWDLPTGVTVVTVLGSLFVAAVVMRRLFFAPERFFRPPPRSH